MSFKARDIRLLSHGGKSHTDVVIEATRQALEQEDHILLHEIIRWLKQEHRNIQDHFRRIA